MSPGTMGNQMAVVDTDDTQAYALRRVFGRHGFGVHRYESMDGVPGGTAVVIVDERALENGRLDGLAEFRKGNRGTVLILLMSYLNRAIESWAKDSGVSACLLKPMDIGSLRAAVGGGQRGGREGLRKSGDGFGGGGVDPGGAVAGMEPRVAGDGAFDLLFEEIERRQPLPPDMDSFDIVESQLIRRALAHCRNNQSRTARFLGITRNTLRKRIRKYGFIDSDSDER